MQYWFVTPSTDVHKCLHVPDMYVGTCIQDTINMGHRNRRTGDPEPGTQGHEDWGPKDWGPEGPRTGNTRTQLL